jgi:hypothetical protein
MRQRIQLPCCILLAVALFVQKDNTASAQMIRAATARQRSSPSLAAAKIRPDENESFGSNSGAGGFAKSSSMTVVSLAERFIEIVPAAAAAETDFLERLRREQVSQSAALETSPSQNNASDTAAAFVWKSILASVLLLGAASLITGNQYSNPLLDVAWKDFQQAACAALAVNGPSIVQWLRGGATSSSSSNRSTTWSQNVALVAVTLGQQPNLLRYLWHNGVPLAARTLRQMLVMEVWNRFFAKLFADIGTVVTTYFAGIASNAGVGENGSVLLEAWERPAWLEQSQSLLATAVKRGTQKLFQKALQQHLEDAFVAVLQFSRNAIQAQVQLQLSGASSMDVRQ